MTEALRVLNNALEEMAKLAHREHYDCEDCFYACPQAKNEDGDWAGCNDPGSPCRCGAEQHNAKVTDLMEATIGYAS